MPFTAALHVVPCGGEGRDREGRRDTLLSPVHMRDRDHSDSGQESEGSRFQVIQARGTFRETLFNKEHFKMLMIFLLLHSIM